MNTVEQELKVGDLVQIVSTDGFNGEQGKLDAIMPPPRLESRE